MEPQKANKSRGQSLVEMALTLPVLLLLVLGFIDLGRAVYYYSALSNAVREGARFAIVQKNLDTTDGTQQDDDTIAKVTGYSVAVPILAGDVTVDRMSYDDVTKTYFADPTGLYVIVSASFAFDPVVPFINPITLSSESTMLLTPFAR
jgi:Flp pilus assembly protein TadG